MCWRFRACVRACVGAWMRAAAGEYAWEKAPVKIIIEEASPRIGLQTPPLGLGDQFRVVKARALAELPRNGLERLVEAAGGALCHRSLVLVVMVVVVLMG